MVMISVRTIPNSKRIEVNDLGGDSYSVRLDRPAVDGKANARLVEVLAGYFDVPKSSVKIVKGVRSRNKIVNIIQMRE